MYKIAIIDDDVVFSNLLKEDILKIQPECEVTCLEEYQRLDYYDVYFLDIELQEGERNGFEIAEDIKHRERSSLFVFISSHNELIIDGFRYSALWFLRKSHYDKELKEVIEAIEERLEYRRRYVEVKGEYNVDMKLFFSDIQYIYSLGNYIYFVDKYNINYHLRMTIHQFSNEYKTDLITPSNGYLVNAYYIEEAYADEYRILMKDGNKISVSKRNMAKILKAYTKARR